MTEPDARPVRTPVELAGPGDPHVLHSGMRDFGPVFGAPSEPEPEPAPEPEPDPETFALAQAGEDTRTPQDPPGDTEPDSDDQSPPDTPTTGSDNGPDDTAPTSPVVGKP